MLHEYAVEPSLLSSWRDFQFYISQFGYDRGRLIVRYPKKWKKMVHESLGTCGEIERSKIVEALRRIDNRMVTRRGTSWNPNCDWITNALAEHENNVFRAILAKCDALSHPAVIVGTTLDDTVDYGTMHDRDPGRLWKANRTSIINRNAQEMVDVVDLFIKQAETIVMVDKHFGPENKRHRIPFEEFVSRLDERTVAAMPKSVSIHCSRKTEMSFFKSQCESNLAPMIHSGLTVQFHRWHADDLHNRFVLTELGGVAFLEGLDQYDGNGRREDVVVLLDLDVARQLMEDYTLGTSKFRHIDDCEIVGSRTP